MVRDVSFRMVLLPPYAEADWAERIRDEIPNAVVEAFDRSEDAAEAIAEADAAYGTIPPDLFARAERLRWIQAPLAGLGADWFHPALVDSDVVVTNMRGIYNEHLANHAVGFLLGLSRRFDVFFGRQVRGEWRRGETMIDLASSTVLIVGVGGSGSEAGRLCDAFGMRVLGVDPRATEAPPGFGEVVGPELLDDRLGQADFVIITTPETPETRHLFDAGRFAAMKRGSYLINIARGVCVVTDDLVESLRSSHLAGAGLDVVDPEPLPPEHPLWTLPGVLITPHVAIAGAPGWYERRTAILLENCRRFTQGDELVNVVDKRRWF
jgi:phosphoglycerate dehydrogenase-like enzyme